MLCRAVDMAAMGAHSRALLRRPFQLLQDKHSSVHRQARRSPLQYSHLKGSHPCPALGRGSLLPTDDISLHMQSHTLLPWLQCGCLQVPAAQGSTRFHLQSGLCTPSATGLLHSLRGGSSLSSLAHSMPA